MPDITMCNAACPASKDCRRHPDSGTVPSEWQWWSDYEPISDAGCDAFWPRHPTTGGE